MKKAISKILALAMALSVIPAQPAYAVEEMPKYLEKTAELDSLEDTRKEEILLEEGEGQEEPSKEGTLEND